jgi:hypothetical protein
MEVIISKDNKQHLKIIKGDNTSKVIDAFAEEHGLTEYKKQKLLLVAVQK